VKEAERPISTTMSGRNRGQRAHIENPDGSSTTQVGEDVWIGGRTVHIGSAGLPRGQTLRRLGARGGGGSIGPRQIENVESMVQAYRENDEIVKHPIDEAALQLELRWSRGDLTHRMSRQQMNEMGFMSTQRWIISSLRLELIQQVINVCAVFRDAMREYTPMVSKEGVPNPYYVFEEMLPRATSETRPDIVQLFIHLVEEPDHVNVHVYSEPDMQLVTAWRGFVKAPTVLPDMPLEDADGILQYLESYQGMLDLNCCYWCEKTSLGCSLSLCSRCRKVSYCSRECQTNDWKAFHKQECRHLRAGASRQEVGMGLTRLDTLKRPGERRTTFPSPLAPESDRDSVWRGDMVLLYVTRPGANGLDENTCGFPRGYHFYPREVRGLH
jgi:hypothetical protein